MFHLSLGIGGDGPRLGFLFNHTAFGIHRKLIDPERALGSDDRFAREGGGGDGGLDVVTGPGV
ncbi:MAG: hypothetical protein MUC40_10620, partial [Akkermansiaceae bacterium]|nr:hypothetical protein [Akkermansiaceae bacterium]